MDHDFLSTDLDQLVDTVLKAIKQAPINIGKRKVWKKDADGTPVMLVLSFDYLAERTFTNDYARKNRRPIVMAIVRRLALQLTRRLLKDEAVLAFPGSKKALGADLPSSVEEATINFCAVGRGNITSTIVISTDINGHAFTGYKELQLKKWTGGINNHVQDCIAGQNTGCLGTSQQAFLGLNANSIAHSTTLKGQSAPNKNVTTNLMLAGKEWATTSKKPLTTT